MKNNGESVCYGDYVYQGEFAGAFELCKKDSKGQPTMEVDWQLQKNEQKSEHNTLHAL